MNKQDSLSLWKQRVEEQKNSGMGIHEWCESKQLSKDAYYYWRKKIKRVSSSSADRISFVKLPIVKEEGDLKQISSKQVEWLLQGLEITQKYAHTEIKKEERKAVSAKRKVLSRHRCQSQPSGYL